jgi:hypothetical protein
MLLVGVGGVDGPHEGLSDAELAVRIPRLTTELTGQEQAVGELGVDGFQVHTAGQRHRPIRPGRRHGLDGGGRAVGGDQQVVGNGEGHQVHRPARSRAMDGSPRRVR